MLPGGNSFSQAHPGPGQENPAAKRGWKSSGSNSRCGGIGEGRIRMDPCLGCAWRGIRAHSLFVPIPKLQQISDLQGKIWLQKLSASFPNSQIVNPKENRGSSSVGIPGMMARNLLDTQLEYFGMWESSGAGIQAGIFHGTPELVWDEGIGIIHKDKKVG